MSMRIDINIVRNQYIMEIVLGDYQSRHIGRSVNECLSIAKRVVKSANPSQKMVFRVVTHGYDANGSPITELVNEAIG